MDIVLSYGVAAGEMSQQLRTLAFPLEDPGSISSPTWQCTVDFNLISGDLGHQTYTIGAYTYACRQNNNRHKIK